MKELKYSVMHHLEQAARKAGVQFDGECRAELEADFDAAEARIARLEAALVGLKEGTADLIDRLDTPDWRERR